MNPVPIKVGLENLQSEPDDMGEIEIALPIVLVVLPE